MSKDFEGVTFPQQHLKASDDANVRRKIFPDCILRGCALSASGAVITMDAGYLMICGRQIRLTAPQSWTASASAGCARLMLTVTVTWSSLQETGFDLQADLDYAEHLGDFPEPVQQDINNGGTRYQAPLCTVSLGSAGVTDFQEQIATLQEG